MIIDQIIIKLINNHQIIETWWVIVIQVPDYNLPAMYFGCRHSRAVGKSDKCIKVSRPVELVAPLSVIKHKVVEWKNGKNHAILDYERLEEVDLSCFVLLGFFLGTTGRKYI